MSDIQLNNVRLSFPQLTTASAPQGFPGSTAKYSGDFIMALEDPSVALINNSFLELAQNEWGDNHFNVMSRLANSPQTCCYGFGANKIKPDGSIYVGYENKFYISAKNANQPQMITCGTQQEAPHQATTPEEWLQIAGTMYSGCYVNIILRPYLQKDMGGLRCILVAIQFNDHGTPFGESSVDQSSKFSVVAPSVNMQQQQAPGSQAPIQQQQAPIQQQQAPIQQQQAPIQQANGYQAQGNQASMPLPPFQNQS